MYNRVFHVSMPRSNMTFAELAERRERQRKKKKAKTLEVAM